MSSVRPGKKKGHEERRRSSAVASPRVGPIVLREADAHR